MRARYVDRVSTEAVLMQSTIASVLGGKDVLSDAIERMRDGYLD